MSKSMPNQKNMPKEGEFCWNELMTTNVKKAKEFYKSLFGWNTQEHDMGENPYIMVKHGDKEIGGMMQIPAGQEHHMPPHWMAYISVENLENMIRKAQTLGAEIKVPATAVGDFGRFAIIKDPTGAQIAMWQSAKQSQY